MSSKSHNNDVASNSPSKIRGGAVLTAGALNVSESKSDSSKDAVYSSIDVPDYPREDMSHSTQQVKNIPAMKFIRRELRSHGTSAEGALWNMLKRKQIAGLQFRRQFSVGNYVLDFYCPALKLAIELDGDYHYHMDMPDRDWARDRELLEKYGIKTVRFENKIVFQHPESIRFAIMQEVEVQNAPSKLRGEVRQMKGALNISESNGGSSKGVNSRGIDAPALTGTPSYPRGGVVDAPLKDAE